MLDSIVNRLTIKLIIIFIIIFIDLKKNRIVAEQQQSQLTFGAQRRMSDGGGGIGGVGGSLNSGQNLELPDSTDEAALLKHQQQQYYSNHNHHQYHYQQQNGDENCETLPSEIHIIKEEYDELGRLQRTCNGEVQVNKCEGLCNSQVQPSVITPTGFIKECYCCRESYLRERLVTLTHCYDPDGARLTGQDTSTMDVRLKEPAECRCFKCGDFSR